MNNQVQRITILLWPDYVSITYEVMVLVSYTEHMNQIVEQFQYYFHQMIIGEIKINLNLE